MKSRDLLAVLIRLGDFIPLLQTLIASRIKEATTESNNSSDYKAKCNGCSSSIGDVTTLTLPVNGIINVLELGVGYGMALSQLKLRLPSATCIGINKMHYPEQRQLTPTDWTPPPSNATAPHHTTPITTPPAVATMTTTGVGMSKDGRDSKIIGNNPEACRVILSHSLLQQRLSKAPDDAVIHYLYGDMAAISLPSLSIDFIYSIYSLGFVYDKASVLEVTKVIFIIAAHSVIAC
jgi:hypothetical protein